MKITVINGTQNHGVTDQLKELFLEQLRPKAEVTEYFLPKDCPAFCVGCKTCFFRGAQFCKDADFVQKIVSSLLEADLIVMTSPVYVYHATGAMKSLLDHLAYLWMPHRPAPELFAKRAVIITQCLGAGANSTAKDIKHSLSWWGISDISVLTGKLMHGVVWDELPAKKRADLAKKAKKLSNKFARIHDTQPARTNFKTKFKFFACRMMQKSVQKSGAESFDDQYWAAQGWLGTARPWHSH